MRGAIARDQLLRVHNVVVFVNDDTPESGQLFGRQGQILGSFLAALQL